MNAHDIFRPTNSTDGDQARRDDAEAMLSSAFRDSSSRDACERYAPEMRARIRKSARKEELFADWLTPSARLAVGNYLPSEETAQQQPRPLSLPPSLPSTIHQDRGARTSRADHLQSIDRESVIVSFASEGMHTASSSSRRGTPMPPPPPPPPPHHHHHHFYHHHHQRHPEFRHASGASTPAAAAAATAAADAVAAAAADTGSSWDSDNVAYVGMEYSNTGACSQRAPSPSSRRPGSLAGGCSRTEATFSNLYSNRRGLGGGYHSMTGFPLPSNGAFGMGTSACSSSSPSAVPICSALPLAAPTPLSEALSSVPHEDFRPPAAVVPATSDYCQAEYCGREDLKAGGRSPETPCESHLKDGLQRVAYNDKVFGTHRPSPSPSPEDIARPSNEANTKTGTATTAAAAAAAAVSATPIASELLDVKKEATDASRPAPGTGLELTLQVQGEEEVDQKPMPDAAGAMVTADLPGSGACEMPGCMKSPRYGHGDELPVVCHSHKKAGMVTVRDGKIMMATRDGSAFKREKAPAAAPISAAPKAEGVDTDASRAIATGTSSTAAIADKVAAKSKVKRPAKRERTGSRCPDDDAAWTPSTANSRTQSMYRKLCEVTGCQVQPSYGLPGTTKPRFCCEHKLEGMVGLKNRPCLFPGCPTRPHYGLPNGRATYCSAHKKGGMVHLLNESKAMEKDRLARSRVFCLRSVAERKLREAATISSRCKAAFPTSSNDGGCGDDSDPDDYDDDDKRDDHHQEYGGGGGGGGGDGGWKDDIEVGARKRRRRPSPSPSSSNANGPEKANCGVRDSSLSAIDDIGKGSSRGEKKKKSKKGGGGDSDVGSSRSERTLGPCLTLGSGPLSWKSVASGWWSPDESEETDGEDVDNDDGNISGSSRRSRPADGSGMVPSVEMRLLRQARDSARAAAEASGSGRRARAPSRKLLEASGVLENEGAQWMTKEIKEADLKIKKELREQRKQFKAAGLRAGEVIEVVEVVEPVPAPCGVEAAAMGGSTDAGGRSGDAPATAVARSRRVDAAAVTAAAAEAAACTSSRKKKGRARVLEAMSAFSRANRNTGAEGDAAAAAAASKPPKTREWLVPSESGGRSVDRSGSGATGTSTTPVFATTAVAAAAEAYAVSGALPSDAKQDRDSDRTQQDEEKMSSEAVDDTAGVEGERQEALDGKMVQGFAVEDGEAGDGGAGGGDRGPCKCEFGDCQRRACFGVNGIARYCKSHRLFGMTEILPTH